MLARMLLSIATLAVLHAGAREMPAVAAKMRSEAQALVGAVDEGARARLVLPFASDRRTDWHYTPRPRPGLSFAELSAAQRDLVHRLLRTALSVAGHRKVVNVIELELVLRELETFGLLRDPGKYFVVLFGAPDARAPWGWRFEGHHLSLNFTLRGDAIATSPAFFGANPARVPKGPKQGQRVLAGEEDEARKLLGMLDPAQRRAAIVDARTYGEIVTGARDRVAAIDDRGLEARAMTEAQKAQLRKLIEVYADNFEPELRAARLARAAEAFDGIRFAWAGETQPGKRHYYRVQGAKFLVEYDASQDGGNHIHSVWRDYEGDFGRDLLREHYSMARGTRHRH
ncbi:MAG TPA: DUF3500 domain-containing protein [Usitatibacter sp.]|nr:DUF3500 domain-containing protein [Usitatibacter sp.]